MVKSQPSTKHEAQVDEAFTRDVTCPSCDYSLYGLPGGVVQCPECGTRCDIARLVGAQWRKPWYKAPGFNTLLWPTACAAVGVMVLLLVAGPLPGAREMPGWRGIAILAGASAIWLWLMSRAKRRFRGLKGVWLALFAHAVLFTYLISCTVGLRLLIGAIAAPLGVGFWIEPLRGVWGCVGAAVLVSGVWLGRRGERFIANQCIRRHLEMQASEGAESH